MDDFRVDEVLKIKPVSEDSPSKREFLKKKKKQAPENTQTKENIQSKSIEKDDGQKHIDIYV